MDIVRAAGDTPLVSNRVSEKADLQNLNHRFASYIQSVRNAQERELQQRNLFAESRKQADIPDSIRLQYEQEIRELQAKLEEMSREKQELEMSRVKYETTTDEYENRIVSLNETVFAKQNELQRLHGALAAKDVELQEARADATQPRLALEGARMETDDLRKRLEESERRLLLEGNAKSDLQQRLSNIQNKMQQEVLLYQQEQTEMRNKLEKSHQLILQLEDKVRKAGQTDSSLADMMRKVREASEAELRRFMEETEAKYSLNIQEVKMRMDANVSNLTALVEENGNLRAQIDTQAADVRAMETKLSMLENQKISAENALENEKSLFQSHVRELERKLQETQDLLLVKIQELGIAQEANIPLKAEINALKTLIEEEERRLNTRFVSSPENMFMASLTNQQLSPSPAFVETLGGLPQKSPDYTSISRATTSPGGLSPNHLLGTSSSYHRETNASTSFPLSKRPSSGPSKTSSSKQEDILNIPRSAPTYIPTTSDRLLRGNSNEFESKVLTPLSESASSDLFDMRQGDDNNNIKRGPLVGMDELPPRPDNPTPTPLPSRPLSASNSRYISSAGQGKDYFDAMFSDIRKDTLYSRVTEEDTGPSTAHISSVHQDMINSTGSATGNVKVLQVADDGSCVVVSNTSATQEENIGGFMLQQSVGGHPVAVFRFPPRTRLKPSTTTTVWSARALNGVHNPPFHYVWSQLDKWGTGPECTTILCKPNGQAIAWVTSATRTMKAHRGYKYAPNVSQQSEETQKLLEDIRVKNQQNDFDEDSEDEWKPDPVTLPSMYTSKPTLYRDTGYNPRPNPTIRKPRSSPGSRTSASMGLLPSRTGSAPLYLHQPRTSATQVSGNSSYIPPWSLYCQEEDDNTNYTEIKSAPLNRTTNNITQDCDRLQSAPAGIRGTYDEVPRKSPGQSARIHLPGTFWPPAEQHQKGMEWLRSQHNIDFLPPMPKAFPCVTPTYRTLNKSY
ncbi:uncharacterized protein LOC120343340 isoform X2 [Styela clava]